MTNDNSFWARVKAFRNKHPLVSGLITMFIVAVIIVWILMIFLRFWTHHGEDSTVPEIKHLTYKEAQAELRKAELDIQIFDSIYDTSVAPGTVMESWPKAGSQVKRGRDVYVTVTAFSPKNVTITMPITGVSVRQAVSYLNALGIKGIRFVEVPSEFPDLVERAEANGRPLGVGSIIPVDASVVLEVGVYTAPPETDDQAHLDSLSNVIEEAIKEELGGPAQSSYEEDE